MDIITSLSTKVDIFMLIFARITGLFLIAPVFGVRMLPFQIKIGLSLIISIILLNVISQPQQLIMNNLITLVISLANELIVGLIIGFAAQIVFSAIEYAGFLIDFQLGFSMANTIDPQFGTQIPLMGNFKYVLAIMVYLLTNGHHILITALAKSYNFIPIAGFNFDGKIMEIVTNIISGMMITSIKIALPVVGVLFVVDLALGLLARTVPQMNVFVVGMPAKLIVGLITLVIALPLYILLLNTLFDGSFKDVFSIMKAMH